MQYVAPDTNMLLHFKLFTELDPSELGIQPPVTWLFVRTVVREIQAKKNHPDNYYCKRARAIDRLLDDPAQAISLYSPVTPLDFARDNLDKDEPDERMIGELIAFRGEHQDDEVTVVSNDRDVRRVATNHGFTVHDPSEDLRRDDREHPAVRENADLRKKLSDIESERPKLSLLPLDGTTVLTTAPPLTQEQLARVISTEQPPTAATHVFIATFGTPNEKFDEEWAAYLVKLATYVRKRHERDVRSCPVHLYVRNAGAAAANDVKISLHLPERLTVLEKLPDAPVKPDSPERFRNPIGGGGFNIGDLTYNLRNLHSQMNVATLARTGPDLRRLADSWHVQYWLKRVRQGEGVALAPLYVVPPDTQSFTITYEIRSETPGIPTGKLLFKVHPQEADPLALLIEGEE